jgi:pimeloyl-ACP methyl ester carboxylesterase
LEALRLALGYDQWNLYGISYGTRLALTAMRDYPAGIRSVILDSVYPPEVGFYTEQTANTDRVFNLLFHSCAAQADCATAYPNLEELFYELVERANDQPLELTILDFFSGEPYQIRVDGDDIVNTLFQAFYESTFIPYLPLTIYEAEQGRFDLLGVLIDVLSFESDFSTGMYYSVQCREEVPFNAAEAVALSLEPFPRLARFVDYESTLAVCGLWAAGQAANLETEPVTSDIPTLVLSGQFDPAPTGLRSAPRPPPGGETRGRGWGRRR